ncbi:DNA photolyase [Alphaproteobacteria bacterium]|nr:DNA photolyase [Alphaproteobacteria bacterium]
MLKKDFADRNRLIAYVKELSPYAAGDASPLQGGDINAQIILDYIDPISYEKTRNFGNGLVTKLSPYVNHGIINLNEIRNFALNKYSDTRNCSKFIQELAWRDFWQSIAIIHPEWLWENVESYKTGFSEADYNAELASDIVAGKTGVACIDGFINDLINTGYVHNHGRMYIASYVVHFRRIKWQAGAKWFLQHLLDGDEASNNFSWQWIASTFSNKPYIFNLENVDKYFGNLVNTDPKNNMILDANYEDLSKRLFPRLGEKNE